MTAVFRALIVASCCLALVGPLRAAQPEPAETTPEAKPTAQPEPAPVVEGDWSSDWSVDVLLFGGTVMEWSEPGEAGNSFGLSIGFNWCDFRVAAAIAGLLPDSRTQSLFAAIWVEGWWHALGRFGHFSPYLLFGLGLSTGDDVPAASPPVARWSPDDPHFISALGLGISYGDFFGLYLAFDLRVINHTHGAMTFAGGYRF